jgi:hypothetical protein
MTDVMKHDYVALKAPLNEGTYPPSPPLSRTSQESENDSLRALEFSEGPIGGGQSRFGRYVFMRMGNGVSLFGV